MAPSPVVLSCHADRRFMKSARFLQLIVPENVTRERSFAVMSWVTVGLRTWQQSDAQETDGFKYDDREICLSLVSMSPLPVGIKPFMRAPREVDNTSYGMYAQAGVTAGTLPSVWCVGLEQLISRYSQSRTSRLRWHEVCSQTATLATLVNPRRSL